MPLNWKSFFTCLLTFALAAAVSASVRAEKAKAELVAGEVLFAIRAEKDVPAIPGQISVKLGRILRSIPHIHAYRLKLNAGLAIEAAIKQLKANKNVLYAEPNYIRHHCGPPNDPYYSASQYAPQLVGAPSAWVAWHPQAPCILAILDTGVNYNHEDLKNKIYRNASNAVIGYDFINNDADPQDDHYHGTFCAGIAAAQVNNGVGIAGIAGWNGQSLSSDTTYTKIMPVKVLGADGSGSDEQVANGIMWAADHGARVLSMSWGDTATSKTLEDALQYAWSHGCVLVAAAGNNGSSNYFYPAASPNVISVASVDNTNTLSYFSNFGDWIQVAAPGSDIASTYFAGGYGTGSGTSFACPLVAGEAALLFSQSPSLTNVQISGLIRYHVKSYTPYAGRTIAGGTVTLDTAIPKAGLYVDKAATGSEDGTPQNPYHSVSAALIAASMIYNTNIIIRSNDYGELPTIAKPVTLLNWTDTGTVSIGTP